MPWHRLGTVSVTQNSGTVTGVNTAFAANTRIGDAFIGPDGRQYELGNVASDTVISIIPPYLGPTVAGAAYAVTPVQGYQKGLADQVRDWVNTYGPKMAGLGTTGNYDTLPVAKGGTGLQSLSAVIQGLLNDADAIEACATLGAAKSGANDDILSLSGMTTALTVGQGGTGGKTQAAARTGLGLGSASTMNAGSAVGNVMPVGAFGLGGASLAESTWNNSNTTGFSNQPQAVGGPITGSSGWYANGINILYGSDINFKTQIAMQMNAPGFAMRTLKMDLSSASSWFYFWNTGNTTVDGSGFIKKASPIVRITDPANTTRDDLLDGFAIAGYGVANDEAKGVIVERLELGRYRIAGSLGLAVDGWQVNSPSDRNGGKLLGLASGENQPDGSIIVEFRKVKYRLTDDGDLEQIPGALIEAPLDNWIDVRLEMPPAAPYVPPPAPEADAVETDPSM
jgi:hypothetical protein